jgi:adenylate kinase family enzyme
VVVVGNSGSGKSTFARHLATWIGAPHVELDALFHQPGWQRLPVDAFRRAVDERTAGDRWVVDGNYSAVRELVWSRADTIVWFDFPRRRVMWQVTLRTLHRAATRRELWNGNRERWRNVVRWHPEQNIIRWAWTRHHEYRTRYLRALAEPSAGARTWVVLHSHADAEEWLSTLPRLT